MFACEDSTSIDCAREMRGSHSIANAVTPRLASASMPAALNGSSSPIRMELLFSKSNSASVGARTFSTISASYASAAEPTTLAPAAAKSASRMLDPAPAPAWMRTSFFAASRFTVSGVAATRVSPARTSAGTPIFMNASPWGWGGILPRRACDGTLGELECRMYGKSERRRRQRTGEEHSVVVQRQALRDALAEPAGADEGGDGRGTDVDHRRGLDPRHDGFARKRKLYPVKNIP